MNTCQGVFQKSGLSGSAATHARVRRINVVVIFIGASQLQRWSAPCMVYLAHYHMHQLSTKSLITLQTSHPYRHQISYKHNISMENLQLITKEQQLRHMPYFPHKPLGDAALESHRGKQDTQK